MLEHRFRGDLDYFRFSSFKSQHHLSNLMLDDFVEICWMGGREKKTPAAKTISCCSHYLMHHLQSGKWTRTQMTARGAQPYLATCRNVRKQITKMGGGLTRACSLCSCVVLRVTPKTSSLHTAP